MEERELPVGWIVAPLLEAGVLIRGVTYSKKDASDLPFENSIPVLRANNIQIGSLQLEDLVHVPSGLVSEEQRIRAGDIVIATSSGSIAVVGKAAQAKSDLNAGFGAFCGLFRPWSNLCASYLGYFFGTDYYRNSVSSMARGVNINNLKKSHFEELRVPLAPLNEQRRIAAKLDTILAAVDACRQRLEGVAELLKRFRQAVLEAATTGELTREWREGQESAYQEVPFRDLVKDARTGLVRSSQEQFETAPGLSLYLKMDAIGEAWGCAYEGYTLVRCNDVEMQAYELQLGDWLFNTRNSLELVGKSCVWEGPAGVVYNNNILRVRFVPGVSSHWVEIFFRSPMGRDLLSGVKSATTSVAAIYQRSLMALPVLIPSSEEQAEINARVEALFSLADQLEARLTTARQVVERLTPALLAKAFRGELVPQDPADQPASVLLERIRAARQADAAARTPSRRGRRKAAANPAPSLFDAAPAPPDQLATLLRDCGALSDKALLAASELAPDRFAAQLALEQQAGRIRSFREDGEELWEALG